MNKMRVHEFAAENQRAEATLARVSRTLQYEPKRGEFEKNELLAFFNKRNLEAERKRKALSAALSTRDEAAAYAAEKRRIFKEVMGPLPGPTYVTPKATVTAVNEYEGFAVENILIESLPGYFLTANFYKPAALNAPAPSILFLCGHTENGKADAMYAAFCVEAALNGFCVLTFDPVGQGERFFMEGKNPDSVHCHIGHQMFALGQPLTTYMHYDNLRALDYLVSRPEVDVKRVAVAGQSGGGQTSAFVGAYDDRITLVAPSCYITGFTELARGIGIQEIEQTPLGFISAGLGMNDLIIAAAPRPYMVSGALYDFFPIEGMRDAVMEAQQVYGLLGADLASFVSARPHGMWYETRRAVIGFIYRHFVGGSPKITFDERISVPTEASLYCAEGDVRKVNKISLIDLARNAAVKKKDLSGEDLLDDVMEVLNLKQSDEDMHIHMTFLPADEVNKITVFPGTPEEKPASLIGSILYVEPRGTGKGALPYGCFYTDTNDPYMNREAAVNWNAVLHGRSILGMRAVDIAKGIQHARTQYGCEHLTLHAVGKMALPALFAAIIAPPDVLVLYNLLPGFREITHKDDYTATLSDIAFGLGVDYDIPDIIEALKPRKMEMKII